MSNHDVTRICVPIKMLPTAAYLRACFDYDPTTGVLRWKERPRKHFETHHGWITFNAKYPGTIAGTANRFGHLSVLIGHCPYLAHRVIWKLMTGRKPPASIDHIDGDPANNAWSNLRRATRQKQRWNARAQKSISGYRCVYRNKKKWQALIRLNGRNHSCGYFDTPEEASAAVEAFARDLHGEFYKSPVRDRSDRTRRLAGSSIASGRAQSTRFADQCHGPDS